MEKKFKPFQKVLYKSERDKKWHCRYYDQWDEESQLHFLTDDSKILDSNILPYEGNEHLVGTDLPADEEMKLEDKYMFGITYDDDLKPDLEGVIMLGKIKSLTKTNEAEYFDFGDFTKMYAVRFSDFNPNDMEETRKHILVVKNGRIVRYKG